MGFQVIQLDLEPLAFVRAAGVHLGFQVMRPWVKTQIVPPENIRFNPTTKIGSRMGDENSSTNQNGIPKRF